MHVEARRTNKLGSCILFYLQEQKSNNTNRTKRKKQHKLKTVPGYENIKKTVGFVFLWCNRFRKNNNTGGKRNAELRDTIYFLYLNCYSTNLINKVVMVVVTIFLFYFELTTSILLNVSESTVS